jgi:hypothetical protein
MKPRPDASFTKWARSSTAFAYQHVKPYRRGQESGDMLPTAGLIYGVLRHHWAIDGRIYWRKRWSESWLAYETGLDRRTIRLWIERFIRDKVLIPVNQQDDRPGRKGDVIYQVAERDNGGPYRGIWDTFTRGILRRRDLSPRAKQLYIVISGFYHGPKRACQERKGLFAKILNCNKRTVKGLLAQLRTCNIVSVRAPADKRQPWILAPIKVEFWKPDPRAIKPPSREPRAAGFLTRKEAQNIRQHALDDGIDIDALMLKLGIIVRLEDLGSADVVALLNALEEITENKPATPETQPYISNTPPPCKTDNPDTPIDDKTDNSDTPEQSESEFEKSKSEREKSEKPPNPLSGGMCMFSDKSERNLKPQPEPEKSGFAAPVKGNQSQQSAQDEASLLNQQWASYFTELKSLMPDVHVPDVLAEAGIRDDAYFYALPPPEKREAMKRIRAAVHPRFMAAFRHKEKEPPPREDTAAGVAIAGTLTALKGPFCPGGSASPGRDGRPSNADAGDYCGGMRTTTISEPETKLLNAAIRLAETISNGHFTLMRFTTNWRTAFYSVNDDEKSAFAISKMPVGATAEEAIVNALVRAIADFVESKKEGAQSRRD